VGVNAWELEGIASALEGTMADLADVYRQTGNADEYGGGPEYIKILNDVKCSVHPVDFFQFQEARVAGNINDIAYYSLSFPRTTAIRVGDTINVFTQGVMVTVDQVERAETWDTMLRVYGQVIDETGWFELNFHAGGLVT
jgi:hypothetical protein